MSITEIEEGTSQTEEESDLPEWELHYIDAYLMFDLNSIIYVHYRDRRRDISDRRGE